MIENTAHTKKTEQTNQIIPKKQHFKSRKRQQKLNKLMACAIPAKFFP